MIFTSFLETGVFLIHWKRANVVPIHKKESKQLAKNYRPVLLLPICGNIFERFLYNEVHPYLTDNNLISELKFLHVNFFKTFRARLLHRRILIGRSDKKSKHCLSFSVVLTTTQAFLETRLLFVFVGRANTKEAETILFYFACWNLFLINTCIISNLQINFDRICE